MKFNELTVNRSKKSNRVGRGISAGRGKTAGRGTKGQGSRKSSLRQGFAGGQTPIYMQLPKLRGFKSHQTKPETVYTKDLEAVKKAVVDPEALEEAGLVSSRYSRIKLIDNGELKIKKSVKVTAASAGAISAVEKAGGKVELIEQLARSAKKKTAEK